MADRIKAAVDGRTDDQFVIMARTDAHAVEGQQAAIDRARQYVEAGADMIFAEALTTLDEYRQFTSVVKVPVLANITEFGKTPLFTVEELASAGAQLVLYPLSAFRAMSKAAEAVYGALRKEGTQKSVARATCRRAPSSTTCSAITSTSSNSTRSSRAKRRKRRLDSRQTQDESEPMSSDDTLPPPASSRRSPSRSPASPPATRRCARSAARGNDLHYRGYDILDLADQVRVRGSGAPAGPRQVAERRGTARATRRSCKRLRGLPDAGARRARSAAGRRVTRWTCCARARRCSAARCPKRTITTRPARATSPTG